MTTYPDRCAGALVGLACGDAVGTTVEFSPRGTFKPLVDMVGGGPFRLAPGQWTDDTSMALCLATSLLERQGFDAADQMDRYVRWMRQGYLSSTGVCFDIGMTVRTALRDYELTGNPFAGRDDPRTAGNGGLMRLCPVVMFFHADPAQAEHFAVESTRTTHAAPEALDCSRLMARVLCRALDGLGKESILALADAGIASPKVAEIAQGGYLDKSRAQIAGTGYAVASLEAALWCFHTTHSFKDAVLAAANLGDDADTTAAIVGQIAGAHYGLDAIPESWRRQVFMGAEIEAMVRRLGSAPSMG